jgi:hypothetical protein
MKVIILSFSDKSFTPLFGPYGYFYKRGILASQLALANEIKPRKDLSRLQLIALRHNP